MDISPPVLSLVVPCFNEEAVLPHTLPALCALLDELHAAGKIAGGSAVYFVDDGSADATWRLIENASGADERVRGIRLSRNRGHQNALLCGLMETPGDVLVSLDADLQDDPHAIFAMLDAHRDGAQIVYGVRSRRDTDTFFKRATAQGYYRLLATVGVQVVFNHADFRLMSRRAVEALREYSESHLFLRALVPQLGFKTAVVEYDRGARVAGESKYPLTKMLALAWAGVTSFSASPLRVITALGVLISALSIALGVWAVGVRVFTDRALPGWASTVIPLYFLGGVQFLSLGVIGEYLAKVYEASKQRPRYHVETTCGFTPPPGR